MSLTSRREFLRTAALSVGAATAVDAPAWAQGRGSSAAKGGGVVRNPLYLPPEHPAVGGSVSGTVTAAPGSFNIGGASSSGWLYNGSLPGPTFRARFGDAVAVNLVNGLQDDTTIHWHGMIVPPQADGHPRDVAAPGGSYYYNYSIGQRACMNWYHPHPHMMTGEQVCMGLAGAFILNDAEEDALGLPSGSRELPLIIRDAMLDRAGSLVYKPKSSGFLGSVALVNGTLNARVGVETALYRLRILNGANARVFRIGLGNGAPMTLIGNDGGLLASAATIGTFEMGPGERFDLLVDFRGLSVGTRVMLRCFDANWDLLEFEVVASVSDPTPVPQVLSSIVPLSSPVRTRSFSFDGMSRINGNVYDINRIDFSVPFGETERWRFTTGGNAPHPVHVHGASFQVVSRTGGRGQLFPWESGWKDTVLLQDGETVDVLIRFDGFRGLYLLHCHKLEHEDMGMMANFEVV